MRVSIHERTAPSCIDANRLEIAEGILLSAIKEGVFPGCSVCLSMEGQTLWSEGYGCLETEATPRVTPDTLFDLASLTKPLACASSVMRLVEAGKVCLTDPLDRFFSETPVPQLRGVTVSHLLTHTSGLPAWVKLYEGNSTPDAVIRAILTTPMEARPGERYAYSDLGYILLGELVRRASGLSLEAFAREQIFRPLSMKTAGYWSLKGLQPSFTGIETLAYPAVMERVAPTRHCPLREGKTLRCEVHDANASALKGVSGHAGLFGTAEDVTAYAQMLLRDGKTPEGEVLFSPAAVRLITTSQISPSVGGQSLGWFAPPNGMHTGGDLWERVGFSHSGFTGTSAFGLPERRLSLVLLTNAVYFSTGEHLRVRRRFHNAVASAIG